jgi:5-oxoprolinase (ATP-hydrolysing) subunit A
LFDVLSIACGGHAGDEASMARVVACCAASARTAASASPQASFPRVGAHPSYPDREHFGRRTLAIEPAALAVAVAEQCAALADVARRWNLPVAFVKPHGALYHDANRDPALAGAVVEGATRALGRFAMIGPPTGALRDATGRFAMIEPSTGALRDATGTLAYLREGFADRAMRADGTLVPRSEPDALITDPAAAAAQARVLAASGTFDVLCVHGDTPGALAIAHAVRAAL